MSEPMVQVPKSWLTNREKVRRNRDSWKRQAQEWEDIARVLASTIVTARIRWPELRHPLDVPDSAEDIWLTWAREQVKK